MPPKITPVEVESFTVKKRTYVRKKTAEVEIESPPISEMQALTLEEPVLEPEPEPEPIPSIKRVAVEETRTPPEEKLRRMIPWSEINWETELGPNEKKIYITCRVAIPFVGKNMINLQFFTESAMNPIGAYGLPYTVENATSSSTFPPEKADPTQTFYASFLHERVIVRYEINRNDADLSWKARSEEKKKERPGYHGSIFFMKDLIKDRIFDPKFVILYNGHYIQLPRLMLQGVVRFQ